MHSIALADRIFCAEALIFRSLHSLDRNADARDLVYAAPHRIAAAFTNLLLDLVLVERAREALRSVDCRDDLFTDLSTFRKNRAALVLWKHELDRVPESLLRCSVWRLYLRFIVGDGRQLLSAKFHRALYLIVIIASIGSPWLLGDFLRVYVRDGQLGFDLLPHRADDKNLALSHLQLELAQFTGLGCKVADEPAVGRGGGSGRIIRARGCCHHAIVDLHFFSEVLGVFSLFNSVLNHHFVDMFCYLLVKNV